MYKVTGCEMIYFLVSFPNCKYIVDKWLVSSKEKETEMFKILNMDLFERMEYYLESNDDYSSPPKQIISIGI